MTIESPGRSAQSIPMPYNTGSAGAMADGLLLERFLSRRDDMDAEAAFAALVALHGPMVWDVCRAALSDPHAAEDAFQATFLILVRKAGSIRRRDAVGPWLYGVARRVAMRAKATAARQRLREGQGTEMIATPAPDPAWREQIEALHEEVDRLREKYRAAVVLCYFEGRTHGEAARLLKCPVGTVSTRLSRARELLRARLTRRGLVLPAAWASAMLNSGSTSAAMPIALAECTIKAAIGVAASKITMARVVSVSVARLTEGALRTMIFTKSMVIASSVLAAGFLAACVVLLAACEPSARIATGVAPEAASPTQAAGDNHGPRPTVIRKNDKPLLEFFGTRDRADSVVYVIDCSGSMATRNSLEVAKRELLASLGPLPPDSQFAVILYNLRTRILRDPQGHQGLMAATKSNKTWVRSKLVEVIPDGGTDHMTALRGALALKTEVIFFLSDADLMSDDEVKDILTKVASTRVQVVQFGRGTEPDQRSPLRRLAATTGGSFVFKDVNRFPQSDGADQ
jgi:RNA polymerase sigma factor (sigma-70 family)